MVDDVGSNPTLGTPFQKNYKCYYIVLHYICKKKQTNGVHMSEEYNLYPMTLSYTLPNGEEYKVEILDHDQQEREYFKMFETCGYDVAFSVD